MGGVTKVEQLDVATYVQKNSCRCATAAALPAYIQAGAGIGATLTMNAAAILTVDGVPTVLGDRVLVQHGAADSDNGIYEVTTEGTVAVEAVLTRAFDFNTGARALDSSQIPIGAGTVNANVVHELTATGPIVMDTTALTFAPVADQAQDLPAACTVGGVATRTLGNMPVFIASLAINPTVLTAASTNQVIPFGTSLPAGAMVIGARVNVATQFTGVTINTLTLDVGNGTNQDLYLVGVATVGGTGDYGTPGTWFDGTTARYPVAAHTPDVLVTNTGLGNLSAVAAGAATVFLYYVVPQA